MFLGRLVSDKGVDVLLAALALLAARGAPARARRSSATGPSGRGLEEQAARLGIAGQVRFLGSRQGEEIVRLLNAHRILVVPSRYDEPFGIVALEGIACGCLVIGSRGGGLKEAIGRCGLTFRNGDAGELADLLAAAPGRSRPLRPRSRGGGRPPRPPHRPGDGGRLSARDRGGPGRPPGGGGVIIRILLLALALRRARLVRPAVAAGHSDRHGPPGLRGGHPQVAPARRPGPRLFRQGRPVPRRLRRLPPQPARGGGRCRRRRSSMPRWSSPPSWDCSRCSTPCCPTSSSACWGSSPISSTCPCSSSCRRSSATTRSLARFLKRYVLIVFPVVLLSVGAVLQPRGKRSQHLRAADRQRFDLHVRQLEVRAHHRHLLLHLGIHLVPLVTTHPAPDDPHHHPLALPGEPRRLRRPRHGPARHHDERLAGADLPARPGLPHLLVAGRGAREAERPDLRAAARRRGPPGRRPEIGGGAGGDRLQPAGLVDREDVAVARDLPLRRRRFTCSPTPASFGFGIGATHQAASRLDRRGSRTPGSVNGDARGGERPGDAGARPGGILLRLPRAPRGWRSSPSARPCGCAHCSTGRWRSRRCSSFSSRSPAASSSTSPPGSTTGSWRGLVFLVVRLDRQAVVARAASPAAPRPVAARRRGGRLCGGAVESAGDPPGTAALASGRPGARGGGHARRLLGGGAGRPPPAGGGCPRRSGAGSSATRRCRCRRSGCAGPPGCRPCGRLADPLPRRARSWADFLACRLFDRWAARRLRPGLADAVVACEISALDTFRRARRLGMATVLDAAAIHHADAGPLPRLRRAGGPAPPDHRGQGRGDRARRPRAGGLGAGAADAISRPECRRRGSTAVPLGADLELFAPAARARQLAGDGRDVRLRRRGDPAQGVRPAAGGLRPGRDAAEPGSRLRVVGPRGRRVPPAGPPAPAGVDGPGRRSRRRSWRRSCGGRTCLVLPSRNESYGMVVPEALASGVPALVSDMVGAEDLVREGETGWVVPVGDAGALAERMAGAPRASATPCCAACGPPAGAAAEPPPGRPIAGGCRPLARSSRGETGREAAPRRPHLPARLAPRRTDPRRPRAVQGAGGAGARR